MTNTKRLHLIKKNWQLYLVILIPLLYIVIFKYMPMYGAQIAFKDYGIRKGILGSSWVGLKHFSKFFSSYKFTQLLGNTLEISFYRLLIAFPFPIILALMLHHSGSKRYKKSVQLVTYAPHFISEVVLVSIVMQILSPRLGIVNKIIGVLGGDPIVFMGEPDLFSSIYVWSDIWQHTGFSSVIYIAALSSIPPELYEAAQIDGAGKWQRIWHIDLPSIMPTVVILLILNVGRIMNLAFQKVLLMQNPLNSSASEIIQTYVYKIGLGSGVPNYSYASAIGLFSAVVNFTLLILVNQSSKKIGKTSLF
jgi:putative aldouronate transport system permease protein